MFAEHGHQHGTLTGIAVGDPSLGYVTLSSKIWGVCSALGNIAFAYSFSMILIEIQVHILFKIDCHMHTSNFLSTELAVLRSQVLYFFQIIY